MKDHCYTAYMVASKSRVIYIGITNNLYRRMFEHRNGLIAGFSRNYLCPVSCTSNPSMT